MNPYQTYRRTDQTGRSRVELLLTLYNAAINHTQQSLQASTRGDENEATRLRLRAVKVVQGIFIGIDPELGEIPTNIARICEFAQHCLLDPEQDRRREAVRVLSTIKSAFEGIREEAIELEASGEIPSLDQDAGVHYTV